TCASRSRHFDLRDSISRPREVSVRQGDCEDGCTPGLGGASEAIYAGAGDHPARKCRTFYRFTDLRPNNRLSDKVVFRYWGTRQEGAIACCGRQSGCRSAILTSAQQSVDGGGEPQAGRDHEEPLPRTTEDPRCCS